MLSENAGALRVLHVAETIRGGIATYFNELCAHQRASYGRDNVHYIVPSDHRDDLVGFDETEVSVFKRAGRSLPGLFRMAIVTLRQIRRVRPDIVHIHSTFAGLVIRPLLLLTRGRPQVVYCPHGWAFARETSRLSHQTTKLVEYLLARITDRIICISSDEQQQAINAGIARERLVLVHNGISADRPSPRTNSIAWTSRKTRVLFIGRLDRQKGYDLLVETARHLSEAVDVQVIGSSVIGKREDLELPSNVTLLGWMDRPQIEAHLQAADLVVIPSRWEAFGLVALEAMRAAKPIVAFRVGALPEIVEDGVTGILGSPVSVASLVAAIQRARQLDLPATGRNGYDRFRRLYDVKRTHQLLNDLYCEVNEHGRREPAKVAAL
ncbi:glycosyltransferase [Bradyrhizobium sp. URHD0069]|uniref:glycosyltransferase n=1 Tax=Bradyrhizobium sp. URHD0069 TaxID=1380355 RepID=UPI000497C034|nr:glycosyltransferase [Bradyrhizobium sp. URHD0069]